MLLALAAITEHVLSLPVEIGVNTGAVFAGDIGRATAGRTPSWAMR